MGIALKVIVILLGISCALAGDKFIENKKKTLIKSYKDKRSVEKNKYLQELKQVFINSGFMCTILAGLSFVKGIFLPMSVIVTTVYFIYSRNKIEKRYDFIK